MFVADVIPNLLAASLAAFKLSLLAGEASLRNHSLTFLHISDRFFFALIFKPLKKAALRPIGLGLDLLDRSIARANLWPPISRATSLLSLIDISSFLNRGLSSIAQKLAISADILISLLFYPSS